MPVASIGDTLRTRVSAQVYNEPADIDRLADAVVALAS